MIRMERSFADWMAKPTFHSFQAVFLRHVGATTSLVRPRVSRSAYLHWLKPAYCACARHFQPLSWRSASGLLGTLIFDN
jgi:hypothetical protein